MITKIRGEATHDVRHGPFWCSPRMDTRSYPANGWGPPWDLEGYKCTSIHLNPWWMLSWGRKGVQGKRSCQERPLKILSFRGWLYGDATWRKAVIVGIPVLFSQYPPSTPIYTPTHSSANGCPSLLSLPPRPSRRWGNANNVVGRSGPTANLNSSPPPNLFTVLQLKREELAGFNRARLTLNESRLSSITTWHKWEFFIS